MTDLEKVALENWARMLDAQELKKEYHNAINILVDAYEYHHYFGIPYSEDIEDRERLLRKVCKERGIHLWEI